MNRVIFRLSAGFLVGVLALLATALYLSDYYTGEQQRLVGAGDEAGAMEASRRAVRLDPFDTDALQAQSVLWRQRREYDEAALALREAIERDPNNCLPYLSLANLRLATGDLDAAAKAYRDVLELNPNAVLARSSLARTLARQGKLREAREEYEAIEEEKSATYRDLYDLGRIQARTGEAADGVKNIKRARRKAAAEQDRLRGPDTQRQKQLLVSMDLATADALVVQGRYGQAASILAQSPSEQAPGLLELLNSDPAAYREQVITSDIY
ncbi:MAG: tetratricopeptide repeat protein [Rubrobacteraceae bacterium]|nr:tetratricopeptide repeat protein [Rubrobacteraceae bacterium]